jgi:hypothetical protein
MVEAKRKDMTVRINDQDFTSVVGEIPRLLAMNMHDAFKLVFFQHMKKSFEQKDATPMKEMRRRFDTIVVPRKRKLASIRILRGKISSNSVASLIQETGGEIRPKNKRTMAIPVFGALTATGRPRRGYRSPAEVKARGIELFPFETTDGKVILAQKKDDRTIPLFLLLRKVRLVPRLGFFETWNKIQPQVDTQFSRALVKTADDWEKRKGKDIKRSVVKGQEGGKRG